MDDKTTTDALVDTGGNINGVAVDSEGRAVPEPEETEQAPAVEETTETKEEQTEQQSELSEETTEESEDEQLAKFAKTKGLELDSDSAKKAAKMAMDAEKRMHQATSKASELEKTAKITNEQVPSDATPEQRENIRLRNMELKMDIRDWKLNNQDKLAYESEMVKVLSDPVKKSLVQEGYISLDDVYNIARGSDPNAETNLKSQGKREALESLAHKQQAAVPSGNAVNSGFSSEKITPQNVDQMVASHDQAWFEKNYESINKAMAG